MNQTGWHFAAGVTVVSVAPLPGRGDGRLGLQSWDSYAVAIVYGTDPTQAQATFREWCAGHPKDQGVGDGDQTTGGSSTRTSRIRV